MGLVDALYRNWHQSVVEVSRTTLNLSDEAYEIAQRYAESCDVSLS